MKLGIIVTGLALIPMSASALQGYSTSILRGDFQDFFGAIHVEGQAEGTAWAFELDGRHYSYLGAGSPSEGFVGVSFPICCSKIFISPLTMSGGPVLFNFDAEIEACSPCWKAPFRGTILILGGSP